MQIRRQPLHFDPSISSVMVNVSTSRQSNSERNETFRCSLRIGAIADNTPVALFRSVATVTILDLDDENGT